MPFQLLERKTGKKEFHYYCIWQPLVTRGYVFLCLLLKKKKVWKKSKYCAKQAQGKKHSGKSESLLFRNSVNSRSKILFYREMQMIMYDYNFFSVFFSKPFSLWFPEEKKSPSLVSLIS